jgi:chromosome segregation protein
MSLARLRELRMVGFKSFAERTVVEFGPGISAVVGPNGSGKSNLADALRWTLGEQGRALRSRRAEDLIFAGSANRRAVGMADVSLVIDNEDRLLPVDFGEVELSRRLFRSGENEYLINRERIRLRDLVELLDDANLADNAFLFIGQGMVDQALALRPEERRPLFEEAAGIRKHQRRRKKAENELAEAESNLERVRDLLAELRPQARRLAAQAEQQEARMVAGAELAEALVLGARARLAAAEVESQRHAAALTASRNEADAALGALREAEERAAALTRALSERADAEQRLRERLDAARGEVQRIQLAQARAASESQALVRERERLAEERRAARGRAEEARRRMAAVLPEPDRAAEDALEQAEQRLAEAMRDADELRAAGRADEERAATARAARQRLASDAERAARRRTELGHRLAGQEEQLGTATEAAATTRPMLPRRQPRWLPRPRVRRPARPRPRAPLPTRLTAACGLRSRASSPATNHSSVSWRRASMSASCARRVRAAAGASATVWRSSPTCARRSRPPWARSSADSYSTPTTHVRWLMLRP